MFLNKQIYAADYEVPNWLRELAVFYEQISSFLVMDTYFVNDIDSSFWMPLKKISTLTPEISNLKAVIAY
jgi:hypothetical protein